MRRDGVVPLAVERVAVDVEGGHFGVGDGDAFGVVAAVDVAGDGEACLGDCGADQLDDDLMADERLAAPILRDVRAWVRIIDSQEKNRRVRENARIESRSWVRGVMRHCIL